MMMRTPARAMAYVKRGMSAHATVEEATGMGINVLSYFCFAKLLTLIRMLHCHIIIPLYPAEMQKWKKISAAGVIGCSAYGVLTFTTLEHPHAKEVCVCALYLLLLVGKKMQATSVHFSAI